MDKKLKKFFEDWPESYKLFILVNSFINSLGDIRVDVMGTQISFGTKRKFAWIWLPQTWIAKRPKDSLTLTFVLNRRIEDAQIESVVEPRPGKWTHHLVLRRAGDLTDKVMSWIKEAYLQSR